jgi:signal transduction histidine kinase
LEVYGSVVGLNQVMMNLITNSLDAMPHGGRVRLDGGGDEETVYFSVADEGTGIPPSVRDRIFDPFFTTKEVGKGTGLGLYIVKKEIDRHGGKVAVRTEANRGTVFEIRLPRRAVARAVA